MNQIRCSVLTWRHLKLSYRHVSPSCDEQTSFNMSALFCPQNFRLEKSQRENQSDWWQKLSCSFPQSPPGGANPSKDNRSRTFPSTTVKKAHCHLSITFLLLRSKFYLLFYSPASCATVSSLQRRKNLFRQAKNPLQLLVKSLLLFAF